MIYENDSVDRVYGGPADRSFYLPDAMADKTIEWLHGVTAHNDAKPWFVYYSTGCAHAPHHVTQEWSAKYRGKFDGGWDVYREEVFARQKALGGDPAGRGADPPQRCLPGLGLALGPGTDPVCPADGGLCRLPGERRLQRGPGAG